MEIFGMAKLPDLVWQNWVIVLIFIYIYICVYTYFKNYQTEWGHKILIHLKT